MRQSRKHFPAHNWIATLATQARNDGREVSLRARKAGAAIQKAFSCSQLSCYTTAGWTQARGAVLTIFPTYLLLQNQIAFTTIAVFNGMRDTMASSREHPIAPSNEATPQSASTDTRQLFELLSIPTLSIVGHAATLHALTPELEDTLPELDELEEAESTSETSLNTLAGYDPDSSVHEYTIDPDAETELSVLDDSREDSYTPPLNHNR